MAKGYLLVTLHAHLPFVREPEYDSFLEENWLYEAISETYLPLLRMFDRLENDGVPFQLAMSVSPTLLSMLQDELLQSRCSEFLARHVALADREVERLQESPEFLPLAQMYQELYRLDQADFDEKYQRNILKGFDYYYKKGRVELMSSPATHPYLPLYQQYPSNTRMQIQTAMELLTGHFGKAPTGFWLPECGYFPGLEEQLRESGVRYFIGSAHSILFAKRRPPAGVYAPVSCPNGVVVFGRDVASANMVWSSDDGYPGDHSYRDFYRDIGHDLPLEYVSPYTGQENIRVSTGFKYYSITGKTDDKLPYDPQVARRRAGEHAENFLYNQRKQVEKLSGLMSQPPVITCPYDAELFGHWWFEGPIWLEAILRRISQDDELELTTPGNYLKQFPETSRIEPIFSSWGNKGYSEVWLDGTNDWIYRHTHKAIERMIELVERFPDERGLKARALNQAAREVLLSQASDWPFIMRAGTTVSYAVNRVKEHIQNFTTVYEALGRGNIGTEWLTRLERKNNLFPNIDYRLFLPSRTETRGRSPQIAR